MKKKIVSIVMSLALFTALFVQSVSASNGIQEAYKHVLNQYISEWGGEYTSYTLFDIDNNGSKELIVDFGGSDGSRAYGYKNGIVENYDYCAGNVKCYYQKNNNLYALCFALQQVETNYVTYEMWIDKIVLNNNRISHQTIYRNPSYRKSMNELDQSTEKSIPEVAEFLNGAKEIDFLNIRDHSLLEELVQIKVILNGTEISFDQPPIMENDRVMVPIRAIFEALGYTVEWYGDTQTAVAHKGNNTITAQINNPEISYNRGTYLCDVSPKIVSGRTLVPVRAISECAGCNVDWNGQTKTVFISNNDEIVDIHACIINADADITINDAAMFRQVMLNNKLGNVDENNFHELSEPSENIFKTLISVVSSEADDNDITYFFYSGHGGFSESRGASIVPDYNNQTHNATYEYTMPELIECLSEIPGTVVIILDSCFSGDINENLDNIDTDKFKIITSCKSNEYSWTDNILGLSSFIFNEDIIHGKFTSTLINGLGGYEGNMFNKYNSDVKADYNNDNKVTLSELYKYIYKNMDKSFNIDGKKYSQTPTISDENDQTVIYVY